MLLDFRGILVGMLAATTMLDARSTASAAPWCAWFTRSFYDCSYYTFEQCLATISGIGGWCQPNTTYVPPAGQRRQRANPY